jgi:transposase
MIPSQVAIYVAVCPVDFRRGFNGLTEMARRLMKLEVKEGGVFVFTNQRRDRLKLLWADKTGMCLFYRRLHRGTFELPAVTELGEMHLRIDSSALAALLEHFRLPREAWERK